MNEKHLMYWMWKWLEDNMDNVDPEKPINFAKINNWTFSDNPQSGEITVSRALEESYKSYKAKK